MNPLEDPTYYTQTTFDNNCKCAWCGHKNKNIMLSAKTRVIPQDVINKYNSRLWHKYQVGFNAVNDEYRPQNINQSNNGQINTYKFCDIVCAKFFNDNVEQIEPDYSTYRIAYLDGKLGKDAKMIYEKCAKHDFQMLVSAKIDTDTFSLNTDDKKFAKKRYIHILY